MNKNGFWYGRRVLIVVLIICAGIFIHKLGIENEEVYTAKLADRGINPNTLSTSSICALKCADGCENIGAKYLNAKRDSCWCVKNKQPIQVW